MRPLAVVVGASQGLGASLVWALARAGFAVVAASRNVDRLVALAAEVNGAFDPHERSVFALQLDVASEASIKQLVRYVEDTLGYSRIRVLILNQGVNHDAPLAEWSSTSAFETCVAINFTGSVRALYACLPLLVADGKACVVTVTSMAGVLGVVPGGAAYAASKAALDAFFSSASPELRALGVQTLIVEPGSFEAADFAPRQVLASSGRYSQARRAKKSKSSSTMVADRIVRAIVDERQGRLWTTWRVVTLGALTLKLFAPGLFEQLSMRVRFSGDSGGGPPREISKRV